MTDAALLRRISDLTEAVELMAKRLEVLEARLPQPPAHLTTKEVVTLFPVSASNLRNLARQGRLRKLRQGRVVYWQRDEVIAYLRGRL